jgi:SAM-dependent methyltransferase
MAVTYEQSGPRRAPAADAIGGLVHILRCPATGEELEPWSGGLRAASGAHEYASVDGIPVLLGSGRSLFDTEAVATPRPVASDRARLRASLRRKLTDNRVSQLNFGNLIVLLAPSAIARVPRRVLVVGGAVMGFGMEGLVRCPWIELVETDVYVGPRTRVVCDVHQLPFVDHAFDAVVLQAVLEHVIDPQRAVAEVHRVLAPEGLVYSEVPFMQQVHEGAYDFTRWTMTGHRSLLRDFEELESGVLGGPGEALAWSLRYFGLALAGNSRITRRFLGSIALATTLPLRWLDRIIRARGAAMDAASGTFFLGRRRSTARPDREIIAAHRGAVQSPAR